MTIVKNMYMHIPQTRDQIFSVGINDHCMSRNFYFSGFPQASNFISRYYYSHIA